MSTTLPKLPKLLELVNLIDIIDSRRENHFKHKSKVKLKQVSTHKQTQAISDEMESKLSKITDEIKKEFADGRTYQVVYKEYKDDVGNIIAYSIRQAYMVGFNYIEGFADRTVEFTPQQAKQMNDIIQEVIDGYWTKIQEIHDHKPDNPIEIKKIKLKDSFIEDFIGAFIAWATQISLGRGMLITLNQVSTEDGIDYRVVWITEEDSIVCEICYPLQGRVFNPGEDKPEPVTDTHNNCRCQLLPMNDAGQVYAAP